MRFALALLAAAVVALPARAANIHAETFWDLLPEDPYADAIVQLHRMGVLTGYADGSFRGSETVTRRELAIVVSRMIGYFERALPPDVAVRQLTPDETHAVRSIGSTEAFKMLGERKIEPGAFFMSSLDRPATVDEVAALVEQALAYMTERVIGEDKLIGDVDAPAD